MIYSYFLEFINKIHEVNEEHFTFYAKKVNLLNSIKWHPNKLGHVRFLIKNNKIINIFTFVKLQIINLFLIEFSENNH